MKERKYFFMCNAGHDRSPSAAKVAEDISRERGLISMLAYGGIDFLPDKIANIRGYLDFFDKIFVMQEEIKNQVAAYGIDTSKIYVLDIPDKYHFMDCELVRILRGKLELFFED